MNYQQETDNSSICYDKLEIGKCYKIKSRFIESEQKVILYLGMTIESWILEKHHEELKNAFFRYLADEKVRVDYFGNWTFEEL